MARKRGVKSMTVGPVEPFSLDNEIDADEYLQALLERPEFRNMDEVRRRARQLIKIDHLKNHFISKAAELLKA
jgi:hypothetical protein